MNLVKRLDGLVATGILTAGLLAVSAAPAIGQTAVDPTTFSMTVTNMSNVGRGGMTRIQATISRWTTEEQRTELLRTLVEQGPDELVNTLREQEETGFIRGQNMRGGSDRLKYAWESQVGDQRRIVLASDQETIFEVRAGPRGAGHMFTLIELLVDANGEGEGTMWAFAELKYDEENNRIIVESYATEPLRLGNVRIQQ